VIVESPWIQMEVGDFVNLPVPERHQVPTPIKLLGKHFIDQKYKQISTL